MKFKASLTERKFAQMTILLSGFATAVTLPNVSAHDSRAIISHPNYQTERFHISNMIIWKDAYKNNTDHENSFEKNLFKISMTKKN